MPDHFSSHTTGCQLMSHLKDDIALVLNVIITEQPDPGLYSI